MTAFFDDGEPAFGQTTRVAQALIPYRTKVKVPKVTAVDCETFGIAGRPDYPPRIVGVSIKPWKTKSRYYAFDHPSGNNCSREEAIAAVEAAYANPDGVLMHHAKFDLDCIETDFGLAPPIWQRVHDTTFLLFLFDPHTREVGLKPAAERLLGWPSEERDAVADWLVTNQPVPGKRITRKNFGEFIAYAPGDVVGPYANGDNDRAVGLLKKLYADVAARGMLPANDRERKLVLILLDMERRGIRVDLLRLRNDVKTYSDALAKCVVWTKRRLKVVDEDFNLNSDMQLARALIDGDFADEADLGRTEPSKTHPAGQVKTDKMALDAAVRDRPLAAMLKYVAQLQTCLGTFMVPWLEVAERSGGFIYTNWNQIRGRDKGARTGRFSSNPNFQNIPKEFDPIFRGDPGWEEWQADNKGKRLPAPPIKGLPALPLCRSYVVPYERGHVLVSRDYSQQEPRILGHFEDGALKEQYQADPWIDYHDNAKYHIEKLFGRPFKRRPIKNINLGIIYGQGAASLALKNNESVEDTKALRAAIYTLYPGLDGLNKDMRLRARTNQPFRTWGGREYYCEPSKLIKGRMVDFAYKMVNGLVQGSAADCTKEAIIRFVANASPDGTIEDGLRALAARKWYILLQVHDDITLSVPAADLVEAQEALRVAMESVEFDVAILSEGSYSNDNWAAMEHYDRKGKVVYVAPKAAKRRRAA